MIKTQMTTLLMALLPLMLEGAPQATTVTLAEALGSDWKHELIHKDLSFEEGELKQATARMTDEDGKEIPCQISHVERALDGSVRSMKVWFFANLSADGTASYSIMPGERGKSESSLKVTRGDKSVALTTDAPGSVGVRLLGGEQIFDWPVNLQDSFSPIQALVTPSGRRVGAGTFNAPFRVKSIRSTIESAGPLFAEVAIRYAFEKGYWIFKARMLEGCPMIQIEEEFNTGDSGQTAREFDRYYSLLLNTGGFKPTQGWYSDNSPNPKFYDLGKRLIPKAWEATGALPRSNWIASPVNGYTLTFNENRDDYYLTGWPSVMPKIGSFIRFVEPGGEAIGFANLHIMGWRDAMAIRFRTNKEGELRVNLPIQKFKQDWGTDGLGDGSPNYTGKTLFVASNTCRRSYGIMITPAEDEKEKRLESLSSMTAHLAAQPLDQVKDWPLDWPDPIDETKWADAPTKAGERALKTMRGRMQLARLGGNLVSYSMGNHYHFARNIYPGIRQVISDPKKISAGQRKELRRLCAFEAYRQNSPELFPYGTGVHLNNPNMTIMAVEARAKSAYLVKDHPMFREWGKVTLGLMQDFFRRYTKPSGAPYENPHYTLGVTLERAAVVNDILMEAGIGDALDSPLFKKTMRFVLNWLTPPDPRFNGHRVVLPIGNCSYQSIKPEFGERFVNYYRERDPKLASQLQWLVNQTLPEKKKLRIVDDLAPGLKSEWIRDYGVIFRHGYGTKHETMMHLLAGSCFGHYEIETDHMSYTLYAKGQPIHLHFGNGYFPIYNRPWLRNRISFDMKMEAPERTRIDVEQASFTPEAEYFRAVRETNQLLPRSPEYPLLDPRGMKWTKEESAGWNNSMAQWSAPETFMPMTIWHRQMLFLKDEDPAGPNYFVLRDDFGGKPTVPTDLSLWFLANTMTQSGEVYHFDGQCKVDMDVFVHTPKFGSFDAKTAKYGHVQQPYIRFTGFDPKFHPGGKRREDQLLLRIRQPAGKGYLVVLYPRLKKGDPKAKFTRLAENVVKVETARSTDYAFVSPWPFSFSDDRVKFRGMAAAIRFYRDGKVTIVNSEGKAELEAGGKTVRGLGAFVVSIENGKSTVETFSEGASAEVK